MRYIYEFIGTLFLVLTVGMTAMSKEAALMAPIAIGSILAVMVYAGGHISGGHYNPAVSLAVFLRKKLSLSDLWKYWLAQFIGALLAGLLTLYFKGAPAQTPLTLETFKTLLAEFLFTFALCYVVLNVATTEKTKGNSYFGFAIGFTVLAGAYAVGAISGGAFNPAVALGITVMNISVWPNIWLFFLANFLGAVAAATLFNKAHSKEVV